MLGYIGKCKRLGVCYLWGLAVLFSFLQTLAGAQNHASPPANKSKQSHDKAPKKQPPEPVFVLVGAGDIASCKDPEGAQATAKLIDKIPGTVLPPATWHTKKGAP
jgi:hypothetical protein